VVTRALLRTIGYSETAWREQVLIASMNSIQQAPRCVIEEVAALGRRVAGLEVVAHDLPAGLPFVGLLGLDFLRGRRLSIDFRRGEIELT